MIESRLDPLTDGTGGGYGNYAGLTVAQIAERFRALADEGHNRSARAILRIVHEQTAARGSLGAQRLLVAFGALAVGVLGFVRAFAPLEMRGKVTLYLAVSLGMTALFLLGAVTVERTRARNVAQVREIRRLALFALERVVESPGFKAKPLEREHLRSLGEMRNLDRRLWSRVAHALGHP